MNKEELRSRIDEIEMRISRLYYYEDRDAVKERLARLEQLYTDLYGY